MPSHHPTAEILIDYASGGLRLSHALCIAVHLENCVACRQQISKLERVGAYFFETARHQTTVHQDMEVLKERVFAEIDRAAISAPAPVPKPQVPAVPADYPVPRSLHQFVKNGYGQLEWSRLSTAIKLAPLCHDQGEAQVAISRVKPGGKMPHHTHTGREITVVLEGSFSDEDGIYRKGDFVVRNSRDKHKPTVTRDAECLCLIALDGPIQFTGFFTRWLNPLLRLH